MSDSQRPCQKDSRWGGKRFHPPCTLHYTSKTASTPATEARKSGWEDPRLVPPYHSLYRPSASTKMRLALRSHRRNTDAGAPEPHHHHHHHLSDTSSCHEEHHHALLQSLNASRRNKAEERSDNQPIVPYQKDHMILCEEDQGYNKKARVMERVEVILSYSQRRKLIKIVCVPEGEPETIPDLHFLESMDDIVEAKQDPPGLEPPTFLEELARSVLDPCQCQSFLKPALRKEKRSDDGIRNSVSFDTVDIKEFPMTLGDHPSAASGPPVTLDWERLERERSLNLDEYEASRTPRRSRKQLKLSLRDRKGILQNQFSADEVNKAWQEAKAIREQRKETIERGLVMMFMDDFMETASRRMHRVGNSFSSIIL